MFASHKEIFVEMPHCRTLGTREKSDGKRWKLAETKVTLMRTYDEKTVRSRNTLQSGVGAERRGSAISSRCDKKNRLDLPPLRTLGFPRAPALILLKLQLVEIMKITGFLMMPAGWFLVIAALVMLRGLPRRTCSSPPALEWKSWG
jgi:hypothetical protein